MKKVLYLLFLMITFACGHRANEYDKTGEVQDLSSGHQIVEKKYLGQVEGIRATDSMLVTIDYNDGMSYTLFDVESGDSILRFGAIGHGNNEIPMGCDIIVCNKSFVAFDDETHLIVTYSIDKDSFKTNQNVIKYHSKDIQLSRLALTNNGLCLGKGTYKDRYEYVLFDENGKVLDYGCDIYNSDFKDFNTYHKFLSNQGQLAKHPNKDLFVGTTNYSSNIVFLSVSGKKINVIKSIRGGDPLLEKQTIGGISRVLPMDKTINGFLDLGVSDKYVYALYSDERLKDSQYCSNTILVFDWNGNEVRKLKTHNIVYYIAANSSCLYTVEKDKDGFYIIVSYLLNNENEESN